MAGRAGTEIWSTTVTPEKTAEKDRASERICAALRLAKPALNQVRKQLKRY
jgi:hypothetical protein